MMIERRRGTRLLTNDELTFDKATAADIEYIIEMLREVEDQHAQVRTAITVLSFRVAHMNKRLQR